MTNIIVGVFLIICNTVLIGRNCKLKQDIRKINNKQIAERIRRGV